MFTSWLKPAPTRRPLDLAALEDRTVPATFYVDPTFAGQADGAVVTFNQAYAGETPNLVYASTVAFYQANAATVTAFSDLAVAIQVSELAAGADTIRLAQGQTDLSNPLTAAGSGLGSEQNITQELAIVGSGLGASIVRPTADTSFDGAANEFTALLRVDATGDLTVQDFTLDGGGFRVGAGVTVTDGGQADFVRAAVSDIVFTPTGGSSGAAVVVQNASTATFTDAVLNGYGRAGVLAFDSTATIINSTITGRGAGAFANNGVEASGSVVTISGSTITENNGTVGADLSSGVLALVGLNVPAVPSVVTITGSTIRQNTTGVGIGVGNTPSDPSTLTVSDSNISGNQIGVDGRGALAPLSALNNFFGDASGPFAPAALNPVGNPAGLGNPVYNTLFTPFRTTPAPVVGATLAVSVDPVPLADPNTLPAFVEFDVTFATPVTGFDAADVAATVASGAVTTVTVTPGASAADYRVRVTGTFAANDVVTAQVRAQAATSTIDGRVSAASNTGSLTIAVPGSTLGVSVDRAAGQNAVETAIPASVAFTVTFAEPVTGFEAADVVAAASSGAATTVAVTPVSATVYTVTVSGAFAASDVVSARVLVNAATSSVSGETNAASNTATVAVQVPPAVPPVPPAGPILGVAVNPVGPAVVTTVPASVAFTVTFAEPVTGFEAADVVAAASSGAATTVAVTATSATVYTVTVTGTFAASDVVTARVVAGAAASTTSTATSSASNTAAVAIQVPAVPPAGAILGVAVNPAGPALVTSVPASVAFTVTFAEPVTGFAAADVVAAASSGAATTVTVSGSGASYTVTVSGAFAASDVVTARVVAGAAASTTSTATSSASNTAAVAIQVPATVPPPVAPVGQILGVTVNPAVQPVLTAVPASVPFAVTFAEAVTGFAAADVIATAASGAALTTTVTGAGAFYTVTVTGAFAATDVVSVRVVGGAAASSVSTATSAESNTATVAVRVPGVVPPVVPPPVVPPVVPPGTPTALFAAGAGPGVRPEVQVFGPGGLSRARFLAFEPSYTGGVATATGDITGDGVDDIVVGTFAGGGPRVRAFDGVTLAVVADFFAYDPSFRGGVNVAVGDIDGDGVAEIVTGAGAGGGPHVRLFSATGADRGGFFALDPNLRTGVAVSAADLDGDGVAEIVAGGGVGAGPTVTVSNAAGVVQATFLAAPESFRGGVNVAAFPAAGGVGSIVVAAATGGGQAQRFTPAGVPVGAALTPYDGFAGGVSVAAADINGDGAADLLTAPGVGGSARVRGFTTAGASLFDQIVFADAGRGGAFVG